MLVLVLVLALALALNTSAVLDSTGGGHLDGDSRWGREERGTARVLARAPGILVLALVLALVPVLVVLVLVLVLVLALVQVLAPALALALALDTSAVLDSTGGGHLDGDSRE